MRVVQLVMAPQHRGAELFALQLSRELITCGVQVKCIALYEPQGHPIDTTSIDWVNLNASKSKGLNLSLLKSLRDELRVFNPDIVQANAGDTLKYAVLVKLIFGIRYQVVFRNASTVSSYLKSKSQRWLYSQLYRSVAQVISVSDFSRHDFVSMFPFMSGKIMTIPNGLNISQSFKTHPSFDQADFNIVHVAGYTFEKNHLGLLRIFKRAMSAVPNAKLWLVGDGPLRARIEQNIAEEKLERVVVVGAVQNPLDYIAASAVLVLPSIVEGMPGVILEAMFCQTPVVAYGVGGIPEVVIDGKTGFVIPPNNETAFAETIVSIYNQRPVDMVKSAHAFVCTDFSSGSIANKFMDVYRALI